MQPGLNLNDKLQVEEGKELGEIFIEILSRFGVINIKKNPEIQDTLSEIDAFFNFLEGQSKARENKVSLTQKNEVASVKFETVMKNAFGDMSWINVGENDKKRIIFESQRKLILAVFFLDLRAYFTKVNRQTAELVTDLENSLSTIIERGPGESEMRKWKLGGKEYKVLVDFRAKSFESFVRKVFVRDIYNQNLINDIKDFYGQSIIFDKLEKEDLVQRKRDIPANCIFKDKDGKETNEKLNGQFNAEQPVFDYINDMCRLACEKGFRVEILEYKEFKNSFSGNSIGSSDKIRMCKFYIKVVNKEGEESTKEIQIYLPGEIVNENGVTEYWTGTQFYNYKKEDDARYSLDRLFVEGNITSFIGLFFPAYIYGEDIAKLFTGKF